MMGFFADGIHLMGIFLTGFFQGFHREIASVYQYIQCYSGYLEKIDTDGQLTLATLRLFCFVGLKPTVHMQLNKTEIKYVLCCFHIY